MATKNIDDIVNEMADEIAREEMNSFLQQIKKLKEVCESPIELALAAALIKAGRKLTEDQHLWMHAKGTTWSQDFPSPVPFDGYFLFPQSDVGRYRVDFFIVVEASGKRHYIVVECDGHEFHEATKEQAAHDKKRDRWMTGQGIKVFRFTGSEIWKDPEACADQIYDLLLELSPSRGSG